MHGYMWRLEVNFRCHSSGAVYLVLENRIFHWLERRLVWVIIELQGSSCSSLSSSRIPDACYHTQHFYKDAGSNSCLHVCGTSTLVTALSLLPTNRTLLNVAVFRYIWSCVMKSSQYPASEQRLRYSVVSYSVYCGVGIFLSVCIKHKPHLQILSNWMINLSSIIKSYNPWPWKEKFVVIPKFFNTY